MLVVATAGDWGVPSSDPWFVLAVGGAVLGVLLLAFVVVTALLRRSHHLAVGALTEADQRAVHEALVASERKTVGEILPVVVERSDPHPGADWLAALVFSLLGTVLAGVWLPWDLPIVVVLAQCVAGALGFGLSRLLPGMKQRFIFPDRARRVADEQAFQEFYKNGLHKTEAATGVLIFVSLLEQRVVILADEGIAADVDGSFWADTDKAVLAGIRAGSLRDGLIAGIEKAGECLATYHPWQEGDRNEIPDRLILRRE